MHQPRSQSSTALQAFEPVAQDFYSIEAVAHITHIARHQIAVYCRHGLVSPVSSPEFEGWWFDHEAIRELRHIDDLRLDHGINLTGLRLISDLSREVERLRDEVRNLRRV